MCVLIIIFVRFAFRLVAFVFCGCVCNLLFIFHFWESVFECMGKFNVFMCVGLFFFKQSLCMCILCLFIYSFNDILFSWCTRKFYFLHLGSMLIVHALSFDSRQLIARRRTTRRLLSVSLSSILLKLTWRRNFVRNWPDFLAKSCS